MNQNRNKANESSTEIMIIADRSGSMSGTIKEARNSINRLIKEQQEVEGEAYFTFAMFDEVYQRDREAMIIQEVKPIGKEYSARGLTALFDSIGRSINYLEDRLKKLSKKPENIIVSIITDGYENASQEFTKSQIAKMVTEKKKEGWIFKFIGANIDAFTEGAGMGFDNNDTVQYTATLEGTRSMYGTLSADFSAIRGKGE